MPVMLCLVICVIMINKKALTFDLKALKLDRGQNFTNVVFVLMKSHDYS